jgi:hypothetical protein
MKEHHVPNTTHKLKRIVCLILKHKPLEYERTFTGEIVVSKRRCSRCGERLCDTAEYQ